MTIARKTITLILLLVSISSTNCSANKNVSSKSKIEKEVTMQQETKRFENKESKKDTVSKIQIEQYKKEAKKYYFKFYSPDSEKKKYVEIVWNWMLKDAFDGKYDLKQLQEMSPSTFNPKGKRAFIFADFNNDNIKDFLVLPGYGGSGGFSAYMFLGPDYPETTSIGQLLSNQAPVYILNSSTNGFKDLIINSRFLHKFNKKQMGYEIIRYSKTKLKENSKKLHFKSYSNDSDKGKVIEKISTIINKDKPLDKNMNLIFVDLNKDKKDDIIAVSQENQDENEGYIFLAPDYSDPIRIALNMNGDNIDSDLPVYVLETFSRGLKDLLINEKYLCESKNIFVDTENYRCFSVKK